MSFLTTIARSAALSVCPATRVVPSATTSLAARGVHTLPSSTDPMTCVLSRSLPDPHVLTACPHKALEPQICRKIMELQDSKHHQAYVNDLNAAEEPYAKVAAPREQIKLQSALSSTKHLAPQLQGGGELKFGPLKDVIAAAYGSVNGECYVCVHCAEDGGWSLRLLSRRRGYYLETEKLEIATILTPNPLLPPVPIIDI
ncbi:hypothetical protein K466DRAFT_606575 [Polyporus arcularius HHB13444]|uniref:superoxide dismutase n=1 Tax=Polyporus arcularius HHB13444 TaxID=1314778 RepID=A0A5C3NPG0_9APHY|nr:hypothetical protein K466DRAFT_606575 [Polyporus arcularius HHB13444]